MENVFRIILFTIFGVLPVVLVTHSVLAIAAGAMHIAKRAPSCDLCCYAGTKDEGEINPMLPCWQLRLIKKLGLACPYCFDKRVVDPKAIHREVSQKYSSLLLSVIKVAVPLFLGWLWALTWLHGR